MSAPRPAGDPARVSSFPDLPGLHLIDLDQDLVGQRRFISCWVRQRSDLTYLVDPGPPATAARLLAALADLGVARLDLVLLTHIHLDHAGATADVLDRWPDARVVCHERARRHLADPTRLWSGSRAVLREKALVYGEPRPVPAGALTGAETAVAAGLRVVETPGHAPHHQCFADGELLYAGEAAGTFSALGRGSDTAEPYLRPATPPTFRPDVARASLTRLLDLRPRPTRLLFAHHGLYDGDVPGLLAQARDQLALWVATAAEVAAGRGGPPAADGDAGEEELMAAIGAELARRDPLYARVAMLPPDIREREDDFLRQTLRGILGHLRDAD